MNKFSATSFTHNFSKTVVPALFVLAHLFAVSLVHADTGATPTATCATDTSTGLVLVSALDVSEPCTVKQSTGSKPDPILAFCPQCGFGIGVGYIRYNALAVTNATVHAGAGGPVQIDDSAHDNVAFWLETHGWLWTWGKGEPLFGKGNAGPHLDAPWGIGPFIAIQAGSTQSTGTSPLLGSFAIGVMWGLQQQAQPGQETLLIKASTKFKASDWTSQRTQSVAALVASGDIEKPRAVDQTPPKRATSFNIGVGFASTSIQTLGAGLAPGQPLPANVGSVYYQTRRVQGPVVIASFAWQ